MALEDSPATYSLGELVLSAMQTSQSSGALELEKQEFTLSVSCLGDS
jgi:hypothetical protein